LNTTVKNTRTIALTVSGLLGASALCVAAAPPIESPEEPPNPIAAVSDTVALGAASENEAQAKKDDEVRDWFLALSFANAYPELESEELLNKYFNIPMRIIAPGYDDVTTFGDLRDWHLLWAPNLGIGRILSKRWAAFLLLGYATGPVKTKADDPSIFLFPLHTHVEIKRAAFVATPGVDFFPLGMVEQRKYHGLKDRLRASKPMLGARATWTYASYDAKIQVGFKPFRNLVNVKVSDGWNIWGLNLNAGVDLPLTQRNQLNVNAGHSFFADQHHDFDGHIFSVTWKCFF